MVRIANNFTITETLLYTFLLDKCQQIENISHGSLPIKGTDDDFYARLDRAAAAEKGDLARHKSLQHIPIPAEVLLERSWEGKESVEGIIAGIRTARKNASKSLHLSGS